MALPIAAGLAPNRLLQKRWLRMTTPGADGESSAAVDTRPSDGRVPMTSKKLPDTMTDRRRSGSPPPVTFIGHDA